MAGQLRVDIPWLTPIELDPAVSLRSTDSLVKGLRRQLSAALKDQGFAPQDLSRSVYIIRMTGDFVIAYPRGRSPVLYVGRGSAFYRLASHLKLWLSEVKGFGHDVRIEIRICRPRRRNSADLFKYVEADLIARFQRRFGVTPFFNRKRELSFEDRADFTLADEKRFSAVLGVGRGKRPRWAIAPTPANKDYGTFYQGEAR